HLQLQRSSECLPASGEAHLVGAGNSQRTVCSLAVVVQVVALRRTHTLIAQVPHEAVQTGFDLDLLLRLFVLRIERRLRLIGLFAGVLAYPAPVGIQDFEGGLALGFCRQVEVNDRARWRVLPNQRRARAPAAQVADGGSRLVEV